MKLTADHAEIRRWIEERGGTPGVVPVGDGRNRLGVAFDGADCEPLSWDEFFERFDRESLAFAYPLDAKGEGVRAAKLVSR
jgi:hypothetical protein